MSTSKPKDPPRRVPPYSCFLADASACISKQLDLIEGFALIAGRQSDPDACLALIKISATTAHEIVMLYVALGRQSMPFPPPVDVRLLVRVATQSAPLAEVAAKLGDVARSISPLISERRTDLRADHELVPALLAWLPSRPCGPADRDLEQTIRYVVTHEPRAHTCGSILCLQ
jgi:hypothetical protein